MVVCSLKTTEPFLKDKRSDRRNSVNVRENIESVSMEFGDSDENL